MILSLATHQPDDWRSTCLTFNRLWRRELIQNKILLNKAHIEEKIINRTNLKSLAHKNLQTILELLSSSNASQYKLLRIIW